MDRLAIKNKYGGLCAYSGTPLEDDWQVDHFKPRVSFKNKKEADHIDNLMPCQAIINHYKGYLPMDIFKSWYMEGLQGRLKKLPRKPRTEKSKKRIRYILKIAAYFDITADKPFEGKFYYEKDYEYFLSK